MMVRKLGILVLAVAMAVVEVFALPAAAVCTAGSSGAEALEAACCCKPESCPMNGAAGEGLTRRCCDLRVPARTAEVPGVPARLAVEAAGSAPAAAEPSSGIGDAVFPPEAGAIPDHTRGFESPPRYDLFCSYLI